MDHLRITVEAPSGKRREKHLAGASWQKSLIQIRDLHIYLSKKINLGRNGRDLLQLDPLSLLFCHCCSVLLSGSISFIFRRS